MQWLRIGTAALTGIIALSAYAGVIGLVGGAISFDETINARLPFHSLFLAGVALLFFVAAPMTVAATACVKDLRYVLISGWLLERAGRADSQSKRTSNQSRSFARS
jgi:hypothetical protein